MKTLRNLIGAAVYAAFFVNTTPAATNVWNQLVSGNANGSWNTAANPPWSLGTVPGAGDTAAFNTLNITSNSIITLDSNQSINQLIFGDTTTSSAASWIVNVGSNGPSVLTLSGSSPTFIVNALGTASAASMDVTMAGTNGFTKFGTGALTLSPSNSFTGNIVVNAGILGVRFSDNFASAVNPLGPVPENFTWNNISLNGGIFYNLGVGNLIASMTLTTNRGIHIGSSGGTFRVNNQANIMTILGTITSTNGGTITKDGNGIVRFNTALSSVTGKFTATAGMMSYGINGGIFGVNPTTFTPDGITLNGGGLLNTSGTTLVNYAVPNNRGITLGVNGGTVFTDSTSGGVAITIQSIVAGSGRLRKMGGGQLTLNGVNTYSGGTLVSNGPPLSVEGGAINLTTAAALGTGPLIFSNAISFTGLRFAGPSGSSLVSNNVSFSSTPLLTNRWTMDVSRSVIFSGVLSGGELTSVWAKDGFGSLTLPNTNLYVSPTAIINGKLSGVTGGSCSNSAFMVVAFGTNSTLGVIVTDNTKQWTCASLETGFGASTPYLEFNFNTVGSTTVPPLNVNGVAAFTATPTIVVGVTNLAETTGNGYPLMTWNSTSGTPPTAADLVLQPAVMYSGGLSVVGNTLYLQLTNRPILRWAAGTNSWDNFSMALNWRDDAPVPVLTYFQDGEVVQFEDTQNAGGGIVTLASTVSPIATLVNSTNTYVFDGGGSISGGGSLTKIGSGTLAISNAPGNTFSGGMTVNGGTVIAAAQDFTSYGAVGDGSLFVSNATVMVVGNNALLGVSGGAGKVVQLNPGSLLTNVGDSAGMLHQLVLNGGTLAADIPNVDSPNWRLDQGVTTTGEGRSSLITGGTVGLTQPGGTVFNILTNDTVTVASVVAINMIAETTLTKTGPGTLILAASNTSVAGSLLNGGTVRLGTGNSLPGGTLDIRNITLTSTGPTPLTISNNVQFGLANSVTVFGGGPGTGDLTFTGPVFVLSGTSTRTVTTLVNVDLGGNFTGNNGSFIKNGPATLTLGGIVTVTWSGGWNVNAGAFRVNGLLASATPVTVNNGGTLEGNGIIEAPITLTAGGRLAPGTSIVTLTVTNSPSWTGGILFFELNSASLQTADLLTNATGGFTFTGANLVVTNLGPALTNGSTFTLFSPGNTGSFASTALPPLNPGLAWDLSSVADFGTIQVVPGVANPTNITWLLTGNQLALSWPATHLGWTLQAQTNPVSVGISNNWFDVPGTSAGTNFTATVDATKPTVFYRLRN